MVEGEACLGLAVVPAGEGKSDLGLLEMTIPPPRLEGGSVRSFSPMELGFGLLEFDMGRLRSLQDRLELPSGVGTPNV
jgi:hypothetical protein